MFRYFLKTFVSKNKEIIFREAQQMQGFLYLLFKERNTGEKWTKEEKKILKDHLKTLSLYVPMIFVFLLPGGSLLLPVFTEILDRRRTRRVAQGAFVGPGQGR